MELKPEATQSARINKTVVSDGCCNGCDAPAIRCHEPRLCYRIALALVPLQMERVYWGDREAFAAVSREQSWQAAAIKRRAGPSIID